MDENINTLNEDGLAPLHVAIKQNDLEKIKTLVTNPKIDLNLKSRRGCTPLILCLSKFKIDSHMITVAISLVRAGCDPNLPDTSGESPLHLAMERLDMNIIAFELLKRGANLNVVDKYHCTPLFYAVTNENRKGVSLLLFYGADATAPDKHYGTPLTESLSPTFRFSRNRFDIFEMLCYYYEDFSNAVNFIGYTSLHYAAEAKSSLAVDIVHAGANVDCISRYGHTPLNFSIEYENCELFKLIWSKMVDYEFLLNTKEPFLDRYVRKTAFPAPEFVECLLMLLNSPIRFDLLHSLKTSFLKTMLEKFDELHLGKKDRMTIINVCLSLGLITDLIEVNRAFELYGVGDELEAFIHSFQCKKELRLSNVISPILAFILGMKICSEIEMKEIQYSIFTNYQIKENIFNAFKYFSLPAYNKTRWVDYLKLKSKKDEDTMNELGLAAEIPSLLELSRNKSYSFIHKAFNIHKPYQIHTVVKSLKLPQCIQDILFFKKPIYP